MKGHRWTTWALLAIALTCTFFAGYTLRGHDQAHVQAPCVDASGSAVQAARIRLDGKIPCEGTR